MAANKDKDTKKTMDVSKPGQSAPDTSARPVIVTHRPMVQDPMVKDDANEDPLVKPTDSEEAAPKPELPHGDKVIQPIADQSEKTEAEETPEPAAEEKPADPPADPVKSEDPPAEDQPQADSPEQAEAKEAATVDAVAEQVNAGKKKSGELSPEEKAKQEAVKKLVEDKKYFVPVGKATRRRNTRRALMALVAVLLLGGIGFLLLADAGIVNAGIKLPFDFIKNANQDSSQNATTPPPVTETKKEETIEKSKAYTLKEGLLTSGKKGFSIRIPDGWHVNTDVTSDFLFADVLTTKPGALPTATDLNGYGGDAILRFTVAQYKDGDAFNYTEGFDTKTAFNTTTLKGTRYYKQTPLVNQDGIGPYPGQKSYVYEFKTTGKTTYVTYDIIERNELTQNEVKESDPDQLSVVEAAIQTLKIL